MIRYEDSIGVIARERGDAVCVTTMTQSRYWNASSEHPELDIGISNGMSKGSSVGFGIAIGRPDRGYGVGPANRTTCHGEIKAVVRRRPER